MKNVPLYLDHGRDPYWNMAFDEIMFTRALYEAVPLQLRLYTWQPGAITIGLNQAYERAVDRRQLGQTALIRRVTGGRAIYHDESELTYSIAVNTDLAPAVLAQSLSDSSAVISEILREFVRAAGREAKIAHKSSGASRQSVRTQTAPCFESVARHELMSGDEKIVASAQRRIGPAYLQHGAIKLGGLAHHPALPFRDQSPNHAASLNPLSAMRFGSLAELFRQVAATKVALRIDRYQPDSGLCDAIEERCEIVKKNPLKKRDFFEQQITAKSL